MAISFALLLLIALNGADGYRVRAGIVGGTEAAPNSRPYMASLQIQGQHNCGGVLVREDFVLTAAHCRISRQYRVVLGAVSLSATEATKQEFTAIQSIPHPQYDGHQNDVMLLKLDRRANLTSAVQLIPLMQGRLRRSSQCSTAGWGDIGDNHTIADKLQEVKVNILSLQSCRRRWGEVPITGSMVCATGDRQFQGFCSGDSGGPLVCNGTSAGVVSFSGQRCGNPRTPDVYMRTSSYRGWIRNVLNSN
ncbi:mast cell protease 1A-like [Centroberyx gerrardi]|uniref:mast cell protease 1A-like n=1 Tax=Centroberyx gerrardi TaxID=166262 RepID=UPI003AAA8C41